MSDTDARTRQSGDAADAKKDRRDDEGTRPVIKMNDSGELYVTREPR